MNSEGQSLELFFINGKPDGMLTASVFNWTGHVLVAPRTHIREALKHPKVENRAAVYILVGEKEKDGKPLVYIGQGDIGTRLPNHKTRKDEWEKWNKIVLITSVVAEGLNVAHTKYLEAHLYQKAKEAEKIKKIILKNRQKPNPPTLSESDQSHMKDFLEHILLILPAARIDFLLKDTRPETDKSVRTDKEEVVFEFKQATAKPEDKNALVVQKGSLTPKEWMGEGKSYKKHSGKKLFYDLVERDILREHKDREHRVFAENYRFESPSAAANVISGKSTSGTEAWKRQGSNQTYGEWKAESLKQSVKVKDSK